jgi:DNA-binding GntR family transcriptional regulator
MKQIHTDLVEAIREHDVDRARTAILAEVRETREATIERVIREGGAGWLIGEPITDGDEG